MKEPQWLASRSAITPGALLAILTAAVLWAWSAVIVFSRLHVVYLYGVKEEAHASSSVYVISAIGACVLIVVLTMAAGRSTKAMRRTALWLAAAGLITVIDIARAVKCPMLPRFWEALWLAFTTSQAAWSAFRPTGEAGDGRGVLSANSFLKYLPMAVALSATVTMGIWWFIQGCDAYDNFLMSYSDFALVGQRIVNTWKGYGFLWHDSFRPTFFDHFDPALVVLVPLWGLWPDPRLFMAVQAVCLAVPAIFVYLIARRTGSSPWTAVMWTLGYLALPAVGQLNLSLLYGWHPISLALPIITACLYSLICKRRIVAMVLSLATCCVEENVMPVLASMCMAFAVQAWLAGRKKSAYPVDDEWAERVVWPGMNLRPWAWLIVAAIFVAMFVAVTKLTPMGKFQMEGKFNHLGSSPTEILLSPFLRPDLFWGHVFARDSLYFVACLLVPVGIVALARGWPMLIAVIPPLGVLLAMYYSGAKCLGFWYATLPLPIIVVSAILGCAGGPGGRRKVNLMPAGAAAMLVGALTASLAFGDIPLRPYQPTRVSDETRSAWEKRNAILNEAVDLVRDENASVLATNNVAAHLLGVKYLCLVRDITMYKDEFLKEAGDKKWIELFDWVILDLQDRFQQDESDMRNAALAAEAEGYKLVFARNGVLVYHRPQTAVWASTRENVAAYDVYGLLAPWRAPTPDESTNPIPLNKEIEVADLQYQPQLDPESGCWTLRGTFILTARADRPKEYWVEFLAVRPSGKQVAKSAPIASAGGNRPTSWWLAGESYRDVFSIELPAGVNPQKIKIQPQAISVFELFEGQTGRHDLPKNAHH